jgi:uncharacterized protein YndB with AHSA1/START domain
VAIRVTRRFDESPQRVFDAWLDPAVAGRWLFATALRPMTDVEIDARVGGSFHLADRQNGGITEHSGEYLEIVPPRRLVFTLGEGRQGVAARVVAEFIPLKRGCELRLSHENVPPDHAHDAEARWTGMLYGLGETLSSGAERASLPN